VARAVRPGSLLGVCSAALVASVAFTATSATPAPSFARSSYGAGEEPVSVAVAHLNADAKPDFAVTDEINVDGACAVGGTGPSGG
jgi:hypothetical protein